jgi:hypothetical protein
MNPYFQTVPFIANGHLSTSPLFPYLTDNKRIREKIKSAPQVLRGLYKIRVFQ